MDTQTQSTPVVDRLIGTADVARQLGVSRQSIWRMVGSGRLTATRLTPTSPYRFRQRDIDAAIERGMTKEEA